MEIETIYKSQSHIDNLFQGQGYVVSEAHIVNRDSYSVHHLPEDWTDDIFAPSRGARAGKIYSLASHPPKCACAKRRGR